MIRTQLPTKNKDKISKRHETFEIHYQYLNLKRSIRSYFWRETLDFHQQSVDNVE